MIDNNSLTSTISNFSLSLKLIGTGEVYDQFFAPRIGYYNIHIRAFISDNISLKINNGHRLNLTTITSEND